MKPDKKIEEILSKHLNWTPRRSGATNDCINEIIDLAEVSLPKNDEALIEEVESDLTVVYFNRGAGWSDAVKTALRTLIAQKNKEREEAIEAERERADRIVRTTMDNMELETNAEFIACDDFAIKIIKALNQK